MNLPQLLSYLSLIFTLLNPLLSSGQNGSFTFEGIERTYVVHLPPDYNDSIPLPLIIAMHGGFGSAANLENQSQLSAKSDEANIIVVYPEGVKGGALNIRTWNAGWCCGFASSSNVNDVGFINALLDTLITDLAIDTNRIYATGMSNGGFMSYRLACELPNRIAAIAPVAASMSLTECNPTRSVPVISFHSYQDSNVPYDGGQGSGPSRHHNSPQDSVLTAWSNLNSCTKGKDTLTSNMDYTLLSWSNCDCNTEILQYITEDGGHSWPGGNKTQIGDPTSTVINANDKMWEFFQQHSLQCSPVSINKHQQDVRSLFYPNPAKDRIFFTEKGIDLAQIRLFDLSGKDVTHLVKLDISSLSLNITKLEPGKYILKLKQHSYTFIKQ